MLLLAVGFKTIFLLLLAGVVVWLVVKALRKKEEQEPATERPHVNLADLTIRDARNGDQVSIGGAGTDFDDLNFTVDRRNRYESGGETWYELSGLYRGKRAFVEWSDDDELEVMLDEGVELSLEDIGVTEEDLGRMDEEESRSNGADYDDQRWGYHVSHEVVYFRDGKGEGEGFYAWNFSSEDGDRALHVEKWEGEPFEVGLSRRIDPGSVSVLRA